MSATIAIVIGTRPELIKLAPVFHALRARPEAPDVRVVFTGQHRELLDTMADLFEITPDWDLGVMEPGQSSASMVSKLFVGLERVFQECRPGLVIGQGDTHTAWAAAVTAYHAHIPYAHVEAGLRSQDLYGPFPEEGNRRMISAVATLHFAPTQDARENLRAEGVDLDTVFVTGNTVVDALRMVRSRVSGLGAELSAGRRLVLLTVHRRENQGAAMLPILEGVRRVATEHPDVVVAFPMHPNPTVRRAARQVLGEVSNVRLLDAQPYPEFLSLLRHAEFVLTDSGGVQEEAPALDVPVLVLREQTERPEGVRTGASRLVGVETEAIVREAQRLLQQPLERARMARAENPYGDGHASERIAERVCRMLSLPKFQRVARP